MRIELDYITADLFIETIENNINRQLDTFSPSASINISQNFTFIIGTSEILPIVNSEGLIKVFQINIPAISSFDSDGSSLSFREFVLWSADIFREIEHVYQLILFPREAVFTPGKGILHDYHYSIYESAICNNAYPNFYDDYKLLNNSSFAERKISYALFEIDARWRSLTMCYEELSSFLGLNKNEQMELLDILIEKCHDEELPRFFPATNIFAGIPDRLEYIENGYKKCLDYFFNMNKEFFPEEFKEREIDIFEKKMFSLTSEVEKNSYVIQGAVMASTEKWKEVNERLYQYSGSCKALQQMMGDIWNRLSPEQRGNSLVDGNEKYKTKI